MISIFKTLKNILFILPLTMVVYPFNKLMIFISHFNLLLVWIYNNKSKFEYSDFFKLKRVYSKRYDLYQFIVHKYNLNTDEIVYLEFGVANGESFRWWLTNSPHSNSRFVGFDTFEGLPENWGTFYSKGDMFSNLPNIDDSRAQFAKGLFQDTLTAFIEKNRDLLNADVRKVIHLDADLYSSTLFVLTQLYPHLKKGDIILFDEFNVPMHEFKAFREFEKISYLKFRPVGAVNNFYQVCFVVA